VLGLPPSVRIYFATGLVDMRNGVDGLRTIVEQVLKRNPNEGHLFVFVGKRRDMLKILFWDKNGYVVYFKRLEQGRFQLPVIDDGGRAAGDASRRHRPQRQAPRALDPRQGDRHRSRIVIKQGGDRASRRS
jgi:transposase